MILPGKLFSYFHRQIIQIQKGGWGVFYQKVKKLWKLSCMNMLAPLAVDLKINWPEAYLFVANKLTAKYYKIFMHPASEQLRKNIEQKTIACLEKYIAYKPSLEEVSDWINANVNYGTIFIYKGDFKKYIEVFKNVEKFRSDMIKAHQLESLGIEFISVAYATGCVGTPENLEAYIKAQMLGWRSPKRLLLLLDPEIPVTNRCYLGYWSRYVTVISDPELIKLLTPLEKFLTTPISYAMSLREKTLISHVALGIVQGQWDKESRPPLLTLSDGDHERGRKCLKSLGVPEDTWFVCLHVRESGWNNEGCHAADYRNADIDTYLPAIRSVTDAGGWVIRMGDRSMKPLPPMPQVVDYAFSDAKSDWMDVFLCAQCRFCIATSSGLFTLSSAFGVPIVATNFMPAYAVYCLSGRYLFLPRLCWSKDKNRILNFKELLCPPVGIGTIQHSYDQLNVKVIENTSEELKDLVEEMLARLNGTLEYTEEDEYLQEQFRSLTAACGKHYGDDDVVVNARLGKNFLRKYASLLPQVRKEAASVE